MKYLIRDDIFKAPILFEFLHDSFMYSRGKLVLKLLFKISSDSFKINVDVLIKDINESWMRKVDKLKNCYKNGCTEVIIDMSLIEFEDLNPVITEDNKSDDSENDSIYETHLTRL